eukprot:NODE_9281_length_347_cov_180.287671.p3 GENE.NODE_9281_length_347_cov_180.287671~~NODE_9281_length_347_cov_180.287671.p3  ORF type:complete len:59 (+),score=4.02 NODE_9281_length_347_cov_180.287671:101-277(+)
MSLSALPTQAAENLVANHHQKSASLELTTATCPASFTAPVHQISALEGRVRGELVGFE